MASLQPAGIPLPCLSLIKQHVVGLPAIISESAIISFKGHFFLDALNGLTNGAADTEGAVNYLSLIVYLIQLMLFSHLFSTGRSPKSLSTSERTEESNNSNDEWRTSIRSQIITCAKFEASHCDQSTCAPLTVVKFSGGGFVGAW